MFRIRDAFLIIIFSPDIFKNYINAIFFSLYFYYIFLIVIIIFHFYIIIIISIDI